MKALKVFFNFASAAIIVFGFYQMRADNRLLADERSWICCEDGDVRPKKPGRQGCENPPPLEIDMCSDDAHIRELEFCLTAETRTCGECIDRQNSMQLCYLSRGNQYCCETDPSVGEPEDCYDDYCAPEDRRYACDWLTVSIDGPDFLEPNQYGTFTSEVTGEPSYSYAWYKFRYCENGCGEKEDRLRDLTCCQWKLLGVGSSVQTKDQWDFKLKLQVTDNCYAGARTVTSSEHYVVVADDSFAKQTTTTSAPVRPETCDLSNFPNPFNTSTTIFFTVPESSPVSLTIYNLYGQRIKTLVVEQYINAGQHKMAWNGKNYNGSDVATGVYLCKLSSQRFGKMIRLVIIK